MELDLIKIFSLKVVLLDCYFHVTFLAKNIAQKRWPKLILELLTPHHQSFDNRDFETNSTQTAH